MKQIRLLFLGVILSIMTSISVFANSNVVETEIEQKNCQDTSKNMETGEILLNEIPTTLNNPSSGTTDSFIPSGIKEDKPLTREIIGKDNRYKITDTTTFPNSAICYAEMKFPNSDSIYVGTAWMYGNRVAVTAGHCVYDSSLGGWAEWVRIYPGSNGSESLYGVYYASVLHTDTKYVKSENSNYDWGLLEFTSNIGSQTGYFGASWTTDSLVGTWVVLRGYPAEKSACLWTMSGKIATSGTFKLGYYIDSTGGQSGSPIYKVTNGNYQSLGIHTNYSPTNEYNEAERIDKSLFEIMNQYR